MAKNQFRKGFTQKSKEGNYIIKTVRIGNDKVAIKFGIEIKIESPKFPIFDKKETK
jgi:hypothetical protein